MTLIDRVNKIDWHAVSRGQAEGFETQFEALARGTLETRSAAREWIVQKILWYPIAGLAGRFLVELAADANTPDLGELLPLLVSCAVGDHVALLSCSEEARRAALGKRLSNLTTRNRYDAIASGAHALVAHLGHAHANVRAGAAFVLAWFAPSLTDRVVAAAIAAANVEPSSEVRASLALCLACHGAAPLGPMLADASPLVRVSAAIAETLLPGDAISDRAVELLREELSAASSELSSTAVPWADGDLRRLAQARFFELPERFASQTHPLLFAMLDGDNAGDVAGALLAAVFRAPMQAEVALSPIQREVVVAIVSRPALWSEGTPAGFAATGLSLGPGRSNDGQREHLRQELGLPRDPPTGKITASLSFEGATQPIVHWWADFAARGTPDATNLAGAMAAALSPEDAIELVCASPQPDSMEEPLEVPFAFPLPPGGDPGANGGRIWKELPFSEIRDAYRGVWEADGWEQLYDQRTSVSWKGTLHRRGQTVRATIEHDWNQGDPRRDEATFSASTYYHLEPSFVRAVLRREGFWNALCEAAKSDTRGKRSWPHVRMAIVASVAQGTPPPDALDSTAEGLQKAWSYPQPLFQAYARLLPLTRREDLVIATFAGDNPAFDLFALAPTERVLDAIWPTFEEEFGTITKFEDNAFGRQEQRDLALMLGPTAAPRLRALATGDRLAPKLRPRAVALAEIIETVEQR